jgi:hypothetical protein
MTLLQAIRQFIKDRPYLADPKRCWCQCDYATIRFIEFAKQHGITELKGYCFELSSCKNPAPQVYQLGVHPIVKESMCDWHCIVEAPDFYIDFTVQQYKHTARHPYIIRKVTKRNRAFKFATGGNK